MKRTIKIFTDGSCKVNPGGKGSYAAIIVSDTKFKVKRGFLKSTTNQRAELMGVIRGLQYAKEKFEKRKIELHSDSRYVINCFEKNWKENWLKYDFYRGTKQEICNLDLWEELLKLDEELNISWNHVGGHQKENGTINIFFNNMADRICTHVYEEMKK